MSDEIAKPLLRQEMPTVLVYECANPPMPKYRFMACFQHKAGGTSNRGMLVGHSLNWIGETRKEAEQQAVTWWSRTFSTEPVERTVEAGELPKDGRGAHLRGKVRVVNHALQQRRSVDPVEVDGLIAQGWERGMKL